MLVLLRFVARHSIHSSTEPILFKLYGKAKLIAEDNYFICEVTAYVTTSDGKSIDTNSIVSILWWIR